MSEFRRDPFLGRWAIVAQGRSARPNEYSRAGSSDSGGADCPFCEGHESRTPPEVAVLRPPGRSADGPGWTVRAIPNKFPTVSRESSDGEAPSAPGREREPAFGIHEVIIEAPRHGTDLAYLEPDHLGALFSFFRDRVRVASAAEGMSSVLLFENRGPESGGTLPHPHAQLVATRRPPPRLEEERSAFRSGASPGSGSCRLEAVVAAELAAGERIVARDAEFTAFAPFASEYPYEVWLVPVRHAGAFSDATDAEVRGLSDLLPRLLRALDDLRPHASYNWFVHGDRTRVGGVEEFHWHVEVAPRLVRADGYELGSGFTVNPVPPEQAAEELRSRMSAGRRTTGQQP